MKAQTVSFFSSSAIGTLTLLGVANAHFDHVQFREPRLGVFVSLL